MRDNTKNEKGNYAESYACNFLKKRSYRIIKRNFTCKTGELDIIALDRDSEELVFVEVRFRQSGIDDAVSSINHTKRKRIFRAARYFLMLNHQLANMNIRFDIIALSEDEKGKLVIVHIQDAFRQW